MTLACGVFYRGVGEALEASRTAMHPLHARFALLAALQFGTNTSQMLSARETHCIAIDTTGH